MRVRDGRAQWRPRSPLLLVVLCFCLFSPSHVQGDATTSSFPVANAPCTSDACAADTGATSAHVTTAVVVGATGNLAAKYLWVALFRLALRASFTRNESFAFVAGASDPPERGAQWLRAFFNDAFERRMCGSSASDDAVADEQTRTCTTFYRERFVLSVRYMPLRYEEHYRDAARLLNGREAGKTEVGRLVYLAIPPDYFLQVRPCTISHCVLNDADFRCICRR